jgi:hypothetical protein
MWFRILGEIRDVESIAAGRGVRERARLRKIHGGSRWRKLKGIVSVELPDGSSARAEAVLRYTGTKRTTSGALK